MKVAQVGMVGPMGGSVEAFLWMVTALAVVTFVVPRKEPVEFSEIPSSFNTRWCASEHTKLS